jgi:putative acetyltransferase
VIRRASPDQADAIAELYERSYSTLTFLPKLHTLDEHRVWFGRVVAEQEVWVWEAEGSLGGFAALGETTLDYL